MKINSVLLLLSLFLLSGCKEELLLKGLDQNQANEVMAILQHNNISSVKKELAKEGYTISVAKENFASAVDLIQVNNLPSRANIEIADLFPSDALVMSPRAEKARLYSGIEQRLQQSLHNIGGVVTARVHVSYNVDSQVSASQLQPTTLAAIINYDSTVGNTNILIGEIKKFLKNSFPSMRYDDISVIMSPVAEVHRITPQQLNYSNRDSSIVWLILACMVTAVVCCAVLLTPSLRQKVQAGIIAKKRNKE